MGLGHWAVIDIETSGLNPDHDFIIDVGFLKFEGTTLIDTYRQLVCLPEGKTLSHFIQNLTGITPSMLENAPSQEVLKEKIGDLEGHSLLAYNAAFEKSFLSPFFEGKSSPSFEDGLLFLPLLFPCFSSFNLAFFIDFFSIASKESHRGFEDATDLLKVLIASVKWVRKDSEFSSFLMELFDKYKLKDNWYVRFFKLTENELNSIASQLNFDWEDSLQKVAHKKKNEIKEKQNVSLEFSGTNIQDILRDNARIQKFIPEYTHRKTQEDLAFRVGQSFKNKVHSLIQAPTGTGKTLGYLLPGALFSLNEGNQVLVATGTKTLQAQAMNKDIPRLYDLLGLDETQLKISRMVGSNNHLCQLLFRDKKSPLSFEEKLAFAYLEIIFFTNGRLKAKDAVLRDDIPYILKKLLPNFKTLEEEIAVDAISCIGYKCPFKGGCSYLRQLKDAKDSHIIVANHALLFNWPRSFPLPAHIIIDEAHKIEADATKSTSIEISQDMLKNLSINLNRFQGLGGLFYVLAQTEKNTGDSTSEIESIKENVHTHSQSLTTSLDELSYLIQELFFKSPRFTEIFWNELPMVQERDEGVSQKIWLTLTKIHLLIQNLSEFLSPYKDMIEEDRFSEEKFIIPRTGFLTFINHIDEIKKGLQSILDTKKEDVSTLKYHKEYGYLLCSFNVDIGRIIHDNLLMNIDSSVFTSATLAGEMGAFDQGIEWVTGHFYLSPEKRFRKGLYLPAIYDYAKKTKIFLCQDTPSLYHKNFIPIILTPILELIRNLQGKSLLLFSARSRFELAREFLLSQLNGEVSLFIQGMGPHVIENFKKTPKSILLGMESFGEGIDIPGPSLQFLYIDKIPDLRMDIIIQERRKFYEKKIGNEFVDYYLSHRVRSLQQKLGRLLRTEHDFGSAIITDSRTKRWTNETFLKLKAMIKPYELEQMSLMNACHEIERFLEGQKN